MLIGSVPQMPSNRATAANDSPTVTSTCSMCRSYSGRISTSSVSVANAAPTSAPTRIDSRNEPQDAVPSACATSPADERAQREERAVREVQHVHEPVDEAQARRDEEVEGAESDAGDEGEDEHAHAEPSSPLRAGAVSACTPSSRRVRSSSSRISRATPVCTTRPPPITIAPSARRRTTSRFCSTSRIGTILDASSSASVTSVDDLRARGPWWARRRAGAGCRSGALARPRPSAADRPRACRPSVAALHEVGEQRVDELAARVASAARPARGSRRR